MSDHFNEFSQSSYDHAVAIETKVVEFMNRAYIWMFLGLITTGVISLSIATSESTLEFISQNPWIVMASIGAEFLMVLGLSAALNKISAATAKFAFLIYSAITGITFGVVISRFQVASVGEVFLLASAIFGALAIYGSVTQRNLTGLGSFAFTGLIALILVGLVNLFIQSNSLDLALSVIGVLIFAGFTAYDSQRIKDMGYAFAEKNSDLETTEKFAIFGALSMYLNFINLFLKLLRLVGRRK